MLIEADSNPKWTRFPPKEWFSPHPELVAKQLRRAGFREIHLLILESDLVVKAEAARSLLKGWGVKEAFWRFHEGQLISEGLQGSVKSAVG